MQGFSFNFTKIILFFKYFLLIMLLQFSQFFALYPPFALPHQPSSIPSPQFMSMGYTYKFFESSVSYTIFLSLPVYFMPTNYASSSLYLFPPIPPFPLPTEIPTCDLHFSDSVPVPVVCLVFVFVFFIFFQVHLLIFVSLLSFYCSYFDLFFLR